MAAGCINLESVTLGPAGLSKCHTVGANAFWSCAWLQHVDLSTCASLTHVGHGFFSACSRLRRVNLDGLTGLRLIDDDLFADSPTATISARDVHQAVLDALEHSNVDKIVVSAPQPPPVAAVTE
jgi:hypothetical protein